MVHILTHNDLDGYSAGYVVLQHFGKENCNIEHFNYDREPAVEKYGEGDTVVITDYSLSNDQYRQILAQIGDEGDLIWLDHHITAINRYHEEDDLYLQGIRSTKYCGAALAWFYFNDFDTVDVEEIPYETLVEKLPLWLRLVDAWDTWKTDSPYRRNAELLNLALCNDLSIENINKIAKDTKVYSANLLKPLNTGKCYEQYKDMWTKQFRDKYMFIEEDVPGKQFGASRNLRVAILNIGCANSTFFGEQINECDVCMTFCYNGNQFVISVYSNKDDVDCSLFAKNHGGGGHRGAAGCTVDDVDGILNFK